MTTEYLEISTGGDVSAAIVKLCGVVDVNNFR